MKYKNNLLLLYIIYKMVKNTQGGSKHKSQARKAQFVKHVDVEPSGPHEKYAKVTKM